MKRRTLYIFTAIVLTLNLADLATTWLAISDGRAVEANPVILMLGGPFSPTALAVKLFVVPAAIIGVVWLVVCKTKNPKLGLVTLVPSAVVFATAVGNNVIVAAKKVKKTVVERKPT